VTSPLTKRSPYQIVHWFWRRRHRRHRRLRGSPDHVSALSSPGTRPGIRPVIHDGQLEGAGPALAVSRCLSAAGVGFLVILFPLRSWALLTVGLPTSPQGGSDLDGVSVFRTHELRSGWAPPLPRGQRCSPCPESLTGQRLPLLSGVSLRPATTTHPCGALLHEASTRGSNKFARPIFLSPVAPGWNGRPWA